MELYVNTPNRYGSGKTLTPVQVLSVFFDRIPEVGVKFESEKFFKIMTHAYMECNDSYMHNFKKTEMDTIAKNAEQMLKDREFKKVKITPVSFEYFPNGMGSGTMFSPKRQELISYIGCYEYHAE